MAIIGSNRHFAISRFDSKIVLFKIKRPPFRLTKDYGYMNICYFHWTVHELGLFAHINPFSPK